MYSYQSLVIGKTRPQIILFLTPGWMCWISNNYETNIFHYSYRLAVLYLILSIYKYLPSHTWQLFVTFILVHFTDSHDSQDQSRVRRLWLPLFRKKGGESLKKGETSERAMKQLLSLNMWYYGTGHHEVRVATNKFARSQWGRGGL